jgi:serine/threonine protein phosphatase 1
MAHNLNIFPGQFYWDRTLGNRLVLRSYKPNHPLSKKDCYVLNEILFIGHTPVTRIGETPIQKANVWNVDTGAAF